MAIIPDRNKTIRRELAIENQWTCGGGGGSSSSSRRRRRKMGY